MPADRGSPHCRLSCRIPMSSRTSDIIDALQDILPREAILTDAASRAALSTDHSKLPGDCLAVTRPRTEEEVVAVLRLCKERGIAVVPRGAGTAATGAAVSTADQVVLDLSAMNRILEIDARDLMAVVEPGVLTASLQEAA